MINNRGKLTKSRDKYSWKENDFNNFKEKIEDGNWSNSIMTN